MRFLFPFALFLVACSSSSSSPTSGGDTGTPVDSSNDETRTSPCGGCPGNQVCVTTTTSGGACLEPDDAGMCPDGQPASGPCCNNSSSTSTCQPVPSSCSGGITCTGQCGSDLCNSGCGQCQSASSTDVACACLAP